MVEFSPQRAAQLGTLPRAPHNNKEKEGARRVDGGVLTNRLGAILARIKVIAQHSCKTADCDYKLADHSHKIGTITAYCARVPRNKCPDGVNET